MAASPAGDAVFAAGIDPQLALYKRVPGNKGILSAPMQSETSLPVSHGWYLVSYAGRKRRSMSFSLLLCSYCPLRVKRQI